MTVQLVVSVATVGGLVAALVDHVRWLQSHPQVMKADDNA